MQVSSLPPAALFRGISQEELQTMLHCLQAAEKTYDRGETIFCCGQPIRQLGLVLSGSVMIQRDDLWGNSSLIGRVETGQIFGEVYACIPGEALLVDVIAAEKSKVLFLEIQRVMQTCCHDCGFHHTLVRNLMQIMSQKSLQLSRRILYTSPKTIRGRLLTFFSDQVQEAGSCTVTIPFSRQQLADYLSVDRSALSAELSKMQKDGILTYEKNTFHLTHADSSW